MREFDLIVIGSGSGLDVANAAAQHGMKVAVVEKGRMGGTCLNRGCIPSKLLIHSADVAEIIKTAHTFGIRVGSTSVNFKKIVARTSKIVDSDSDRIRTAFSQSENPKLFPHECKFVGTKTLEVGGSIIRAEKILIASGSRPRIPSIEGLQGSGFLTSDEALRLTKQPKVLTVIGGGYIASELAHFFGALGTRINILQRNRVLVPSEDEEIATKFTEIYSTKYNLYLSHNVESVTNKAGKFTVVARSPNNKVIGLESDQLLVASGRIPNSDNLDLANTGVGVDKKGFIKVDEYLETGIKGIFALGDVVGRYLFKHSANLEAQYAFNNIVGHEKSPVDYTAMPHAIFAWPQIASAGYTEQQLRTEQIGYNKAVYYYKDTAMGEAIDDRDGFVKILVSEKTGKILGCHILGSDASILIHEVLVAMRMGLNIDALARTVHIHPALSEVVSRAASSVP